MAEASKPNIVIMLADDMGYGEVQCLNPKRGKIKTPQLDAIARSGMIFTDTHGGSSVCTPTRYGLLTGRYAWRTRLQSGVLTGGNSLIAEERLTLPQMLGQHGYRTAIIGKWHLGMLFDGEQNHGDVPIGARVTHGPLDRGHFDEFHGFHHSRQIKIWVDDDQVTEHIKPVEMLPKLTQHAVSFIASTKESDQPFLLYVPWNSPHSPVVPSDEWKGKSGLNEHADFVMQTDDGFGQVIDALRDAGKLDNTLVICSCDNGTSAPTSKLQDLQKLGHFPSGDLRGSKADIWDGGHRVPFFASWPSVIEAGTRSDQLVCLTDMMATFAEILEIPLPTNAAEDSESFLPSLKGESSTRTDIVHHSVAGYFAIRHDNWKLSICPGSGGWTNPKPNAKNWQRTIASGKPMVQLVDLSTDLTEQTNRASELPERVAAMRKLLDNQIANGRSNPGPKQQNDVAIVVDKRPKK